MNPMDILRSQIAALDTEGDALKAELDGIGATATTEGRSALTPDEDARVSAIAERASAIPAERSELVAKLDKLSKLDEERAAAPKGPQFIRKPDTAQVDDVARMSTSQIVDLVRRSADERDIDGEHAARLIKRHADDVAWVRNIAARSTAAYTSAFAKLMTGREAYFTAEERAAIAVGTNTQGGYLVPTHLDPTLIMTNTGTANVIRSLARVVTLTRENTWNGVTTAGSSFSWDGELVEVSDDSPTFGNAQIPTYIGQGFIQASLSAFEDIENLASDVLMLFNDGRDRLEAAAHATGSGSGQPTGIFTALDANTNVEVTSTTAATIGLVDLQGLKRAVGIRYRNRGSWVMNPVYADAIKALGTALSASYSTDITQSNTDLLLGRPLYETDDAPSTQTTTVRDNEIVFGDFSNYVIVDKPGSTTIQYIPVMFNTANNLPDGRAGWFMRFRSGADSANDLAFRLLQDKTSA